jgi:hypothetical protein
LSQVVIAPPDTFYGPVLAGTGFTPAPGMTVLARVNGVLCGQGTTQFVTGQIVYVVDVFADDASGQHAGCGAPGRSVVFTVNGRPMTPAAPWDNALPSQVPLLPAQTLYLPLVLR